MCGRAPHYYFELSRLKAGLRNRLFFGVWSAAADSSGAARPERVFSFAVLLPLAARPRYASPMRWIASFLIIVSASATAADKVYKIVHPDGTVEYSAEPVPGAEEIRVPSLPTYEPRVPAAPSPRTRAAADDSAASGSF